MLLTAGNLNLQRLLGGHASGKKLAKIAIGTNATAVDVTDSAITSAVTKAVTTVNYLPGNIVEFQAQIDAGDPAMTINEVGLLNDDNVLCHRKVITPKVKVDGVTYIVAYQIKIK